MPTPADHGAIAFQHIWCELPAETATTLVAACGTSLTRPEAFQWTTGTTGHLRVLTADLAERIA